MQFTITSILAFGAILAPTVSAFAITNCNTGSYHNYGEAGNKKCQNFDTGTRVSYDSNKGLTLNVYSDSNCGGSVKAINTQDNCYDVGFYGNSVKAA